jgi:hypothetical protein
LRARFYAHPNFARPRAVSSFSYYAAAPGQPLTGVDALNALNAFFWNQRPASILQDGTGIFVEVPGVGEELVFGLITAYQPSSNPPGLSTIDITEPFLGGIGPVGFDFPYQPVTQVPDLGDGVGDGVSHVGNAFLCSLFAACTVWTPVPAVPMSGAACNGIYNGTFSGNITVSPGQTCEFFGGSVTGNITVTGGTLVLNNMAVAQDVRVNGGGTVLLGPSLTIQGNLQIHDLPVAATQNLICGVSVSGDLQYHNSGTAVQIGSASPACAGNVVGGNLQVTNNTASAQVFDNTVTGNLQCHNNTSSVTGGGNTATQKQGQCSSF